MLYAYAYGSYINSNVYIYHVEGDKEKTGTEVDTER